MSSSIVTAVDLVKTYGQHVAVDGLSFSIEPGESFGLLGPNGAGKTTTISMLVGLLQPDSGEVQLDGRSQGGGVGDPRNPEYRRMVGVAPQKLSLYDDLTALENLRFFGQLYGLAGAALSKRVDWALEFASLEDRKDDRLGSYSGGMKRRINIAVALVHDPQIILLDEPTVGVDPQSRNHIFDCIEQLQADGKTVLYTTHYMEEAQRLCDRVAIMDHGKLLALDSVPGLVEQYGGQSVVTGTFLQQPATDNFPGSIDGDQFRFESSRPLDEVARLSGSGVQFQTLSVNQPDLESVFLSLTGRSLRD